MIAVHGIIAVEEQPTTDGRIVQRHALTWDLPVPILAAYPNARHVGQINEIERWADYILGRGVVSDPRPVIPCGIDMGDVKFVADYDSPVPIERVGRLIIKRGEIVAVTAYVEVDQLPAWPGVALLAQ